VSDLIEDENETTQWKFSLTLSFGPKCKEKKKSLTISSVFHLKAKKNRKKKSSLKCPRANPAIKSIFFFKFMTKRIAGNHMN
jgi:hypothetical protein